MTYGDVSLHLPLLETALREPVGGEREIRDFDFLFSSAGYVLGDLETSLDACAPTLFLRVMTSPLGSIWPDISTVLDRMYLTQGPRTTAFYDELERLIDRVWNR